MRKSWKTFAAVLVTLLAASYFLVASQQKQGATDKGGQPPATSNEPAQKAARTDGRRESATAATSVGVAAVRDQLAPISPLPLRAAIAAEFEKATDWKAFIVASRERPAEGGFYMASVAAGQCSLYEKTSLAELDQDKTKAAKAAIRATHDARSAALKLIQARCGEAGAIVPNYFSLRKEGMRLGDPILKLESTLRDARMTGQIDGEHIKQAFAMNNPYALEVATIALQASAQERVLYQGEGLADEDEARYLRAALHLVPCAFGMDCRANSVIAIGDCIGLGGGCGMDRFQQMQNFGFAPREWERVMQIHGDIVRAYSNGNFSIVTVKPR
jgi:hypothetical protein